MRALLQPSSILIFAALLVPTLWADTKIEFRQLPPSVQKAVNKESTNATVLNVSREVEGGKTIYEVETEANGTHRDLSFDARGQLLEVEQEVALESLPIRVQDALRSKASGRTIKKVEKVMQGTLVHYEADVETKDGHSVEVSVNTDGSSPK